jgi:LemA protein
MPLEWLIPAILVVLGLWIAMIRQRLSRLRREAIAIWEPLELALRERHELVPPLAQLALARAPERKNIAEAMLQARTAAFRADLSPEAAGQVELRLAQTMRRVLALAPTHPELATDLTFRRIEARFAELEEEIAAAGEAYNEAAFGYNRAAMSLPEIVVAKYTGLNLLEFFGLQAEEREATYAALRGSG